MGSAATDGTRSGPPACGANAGMDTRTSVWRDQMSQHHRARIRVLCGILTLLFLLLLALQFVTTTNRAGWTSSVATYQFELDIENGRPRYASTANNRIVVAVHEHVDGFQLVPALFKWKRNIQVFLTATSVDGHIGKDLIATSQSQLAVLVLKHPRVIELPPNVRRMLQRSSLSEDDILWSRVAYATTWAIGGAVLTYLLRVVFVSVREQRRAARGLCVHCGYAVGETHTNRCPECGFFV